MVHFAAAICVEPIHPPRRPSSQSYVGPTLRTLAPHLKPLVGLCFRVTPPTPSSDAHSLRRALSLVSKIQE